MLKFFCFSLLFSINHIFADTTYSLKDVADHSTTSNCWSVYEGYVYDFTKYINLHPAGPTKVTQDCGGDCTAHFNKCHASFRSRIASYKIGILSTSSTVNGSQTSPTVTNTSTSNSGSTSSEFGSSIVSFFANLPVYYYITSIFVIFVFISGAIFKTLERFPILRNLNHQRLWPLKIGIEWTRVVSLSFDEFILVLLYTGTITAVIITAHSTIFASCLALSGDVDECTWSAWRKSSGDVSVILVSLTLMPVTRRSLILFILGTPFERSVKFHRWSARFVGSGEFFFGFSNYLQMILKRFAIVASIVHSITEFAYSVTQGAAFTAVIKFTESYDTLSGSVDGHGNAFGLIALISFLTILTTSFTFIRRKFYGSFYFSHLIFFTIAVLSTVIHYYLSIAVLGLPLLLYVCDQLLRFFKIANRTASVKSMKKILPDVAAFTISAPFDFKPGQYVFLKIPKIDSTWHPYTIIPTKNHFEYTVIIQAAKAKSWASRLIDLSINNFADDDVYVDGPYGGFALRVESYNVIVAVAGGIGITPFAALAQSLHPLGQIIHILWLEHINLFDLSQWAENGVFIHLFCTDESLKDIGLQQVNYFNGKAYVSDYSQTEGIYFSIVYGRPDISEFFKDIAKMKQHQSIGVLACGPSGLTDMVYFCLIFKSPFPDVSLMMICNSNKLLCITIMN
ncbi:ferric/cupric-chelate reductase [Nowakowskiella sp. JEL0078]|nr:ferric/cupric-chelate reductase [Nowakowskiella sp. JEL0078]